jgi:hypothetical protein
VDRIKMLNALDAANLQPFPKKDNRDLVHTLGVQFRDTLDIFQDPTFQSNAWFDTDGSTYLFPSVQAQDQAIPGTTPVQYRVGSGGYTFMGTIRNCAQMLNNTDAIIAGTELGGWDTHTAQVTFNTTTMQSMPHLGGQANLLRRVGAAYYALWRYFSIYGKGGSREIPGAKVGWNDVVVVTMSEFGRTSIENESQGTDHGEASVMYVAGGGSRRRSRLRHQQQFQTRRTELGHRQWREERRSLLSRYNVGYLRRTIDYRSVLGEIIATILAPRKPTQSHHSQPTRTKPQNIC